MAKAKSKSASMFEPQWLLIFAFFEAGIFLGSIVLYIWFGLNSDDISKTHIRSNNYKYINPVLTMEVNQAPFFQVNKSLELSSEALINKHKISGDISSASIYFRDLESGSWISINDTDKFSPGKLLKIPLMIAYFKLAENNPDSLNKKLIYRGDTFNQDELFKNQSNFKVGQAYSVEELIHGMIVYSDDEAANLLFDNIDKSSLAEVFSDLGVDFKEDKETQDMISIKLYSLFFKVLYGANYLSRDYSEKALALLVEADENYGLASSLPQSIVSANRYGARTYLSNGQKRIEMWDCDLIYYPSHPYLACSVARGTDIPNIQRFFTELGQKIYTEVQFRYPQ